MAWQVLILNIRGNSPPPDDCWDDFIETLGTADEIRSSISEQFKGTDWSDSSEGHFIDENGTYTITFSVRNDAPLITVIMDIRGSEESIPAITQFAKNNRWQLYDCSGGWMDLDNPSNEGWSGYNQLRRGYLASKTNDEETCP